jgi:hypothetical protein
MGWNGGWARKARWAKWILGREWKSEKFSKFDLRYKIQIKIGLKYLQTTFELDFQNRISSNHLFGNFQI